MLGGLGAAERKGMIGPLFSSFRWEAASLRGWAHSHISEVEQGDFYQVGRAQFYSARTHTIQNQWIKNISYCS